MNTRILGLPPQDNSGNRDAQVAQFQLSKRMVKADWTIEQLEQHYMQLAKKPEPVGTLGLLITSMNIEMVVDLHPFIYVGRSYPYSEYFDGIDFTPYDAYAMGVSRHHMILLYLQGKLMIIDNSSTNGTYLNRAMLEKRQAYFLENNDRVKLGRFEIIFKL